MRIDSVDVGPSLGPDRFLDPESGLPVVAVLPGPGMLRGVSWSPWRDERGQAQLVGLWYNASPSRPRDYALVRLSQPDGAVLDRISHEGLPGWVAPPCWFPDRSERLLLAGGDGQLYRLDFGSDDARGPWPRPLSWRAGGDPLRIARFGDLSWPGDRSSARGWCSPRCTPGPRAGAGPTRGPSGGFGSTAEPSRSWPRGGSSPGESPTPRRARTSDSPCSRRGGGRPSWRGSNGRGGGPAMPGG